MLENKSDVEKNASEQKCCGKVPVQNMGGVILDIDGTVLDSMSIWQDAGVRYLASQQIEAEPGLAEKIYYMSIPEAALYMRTRYGLEQSVKEISQGIKDVVRDFYYYEAPLKAGVKEFLQKMSDRKIPVVAATASDEDHLEHAFTRLGIRQYFEHILHARRQEPESRARQSIIWQQDIWTGIRKNCMFLKMHCMQSGQQNWQDIIRLACMTKKVKKIRK